MKAFVKFAALLYALALPLCGFCYTLTDASGKTFKFDKPPHVATIVPAITQNIYAIGAEDFLLGNSKFCNIPDAAKNKVKLGGFIDPDYEKIAALRPDIFLLPTLSDNRLPARLSKLGIPVFTLHGEGLKNICADLEMLGKLFRLEKNATLKIGLIKEKMRGANALKSKAKNARALFMFDNFAAGHGSYAGELLEICGIKNCADSSNAAWALLSKEFVLKCSPNIIFVQYSGDEQKKRLREFYKADIVWKNTPAVKNGKIFFIERDIVGVPSARAFDALDLLQSAIEESFGSAK